MFKKFYLKKHIGASLISSLIFMLIAATVIGELFMLISWSHFSTIDSASNAKVLRELDSKIEIGKNWLSKQTVLPHSFDVHVDTSLSFDMDSQSSHDKEIHNDAEGLYIYNLNNYLDGLPSVKIPTAPSITDIVGRRKYYLEKFVAPMSPDIYLLRATTPLIEMDKVTNSADHRVIVESIVKKDSSSKITEIMRQEIWY